MVARELRPEWVSGPTFQIIFVSARSLGRWFKEHTPKAEY